MILAPTGNRDDLIIQAALNGLPNWEPLLLTGGLFDIGGPISISDTPIIRGYGRTVTRLLMRANINDYCFKFTNGPTVGLQMHDLYIDANGANQSTEGGGVKMEGAIQCLISNVHVEHPYNRGFYVHGDGNNGTGHHNRFIHCLVDNGGVSASGFGRGLEFNSSDENYVGFCDFETNGRAAATDPAHIYDASGLQMIEQCVFVTGNQGIKINSATGTIISGCQFDGVGNSNVQCNGGDVSIIGNHFFNIGTQSGAGTGVGCQIDNVQGVAIVGNTFATPGNGNAKAGVNLANGADYCTVVGNTTNTNGGSWSSGAIVAGTGTHNQIANNASR